MIGEGDDHCWAQNSTTQNGITKRKQTATTGARPIDLTGRCGQTGQRPPQTIWTTPRTGLLPDMPSNNVPNESVRAQDDLDKFRGRIGNDPEGTIRGEGNSWDSDRLCPPTPRQPLCECAHICPRPHREEARRVVEGALDGAQEVALPQLAHRGGRREMPGQSLCEPFPSRSSHPGAGCRMGMGSVFALILQRQKKCMPTYKKEAQRKVFGTLR